MSELLPCPFCGTSNEVELLKVCDKSNAHVNCHKCGALGGRRETNDSAESAWNTRHLAATKAQTVDVEKDAERYRWLRDWAFYHSPDVRGDVVKLFEGNHGDNFTKAVDEAINIDMALIHGGEPDPPESEDAPEPNTHGDTE